MIFEVPLWAGVVIIGCSAVIGMLGGYLWGYTGRARKYK